ncbi:hypothetical protein [Catenuloplanes japonicus]|uniref:hypothetical protein n=1 Tax=Catenuloplanes japonicus TaxID=33876 RepID=UPI000A9A5952|nr:hypothetical protein [Catenuloplanes japonicus]
MTTIASLAAEYNMQPHEVQALADLNDTPQTAELDDTTETHLRDLLTNTDDDGVYRG